jgi:oxygen-independent coproporphyrinogen-3 oxidase
LAGLYIHIPFCRQACIYCNFHFKAGNQSTQAMTDAICKEIKLRKDYLGKESINTLYFGGGTPSILPAKEIEQIINTVYQEFNISSLTEVTLEANPDDLDKQKLMALFGMGVNRLSIGVQSFEDKALKWMNRAHTAREAIKSIKTAQDLGFQNISIDIITGIPVVGNIQHITDIEQALSLQPQHLSCYTLTLEPNTSWERLIRLKHFPKPKEKEQAKAFEESIALIKSKGWIHYEISNFALSDEHISKHNSSYWEKAHYLGIGPSAHSYNGHSRRWNLTAHSHYMQNLNQQLEPPHEIETITPTMAFNEAIMTGIRTAKGIELNYLKTMLPGESDKLLQKVISKPLNQQVYIQGNRLICKEEALLFSDAIAACLFADE